MARTWTQILASARLRANDNTTTYTTSDANALVLFNDDYQIYKSQVDDRVRDLPMSTWITSGWPAASPPGHQLVRYVDTSITTIRRIISLRPSTSAAALFGANAVAELEYVEPWEMDLYYSEDTDVDNVATAASLRWTYTDLGTDTGASVGVKRVWIHPAPLQAGAGSYFVMRAVVAPANPTTGSDIPDLSDAEGAGLAKVLAYRLALRGGKLMPFVQAIAAEVPQDMQAILGFNVEKASIPAKVTGARA